MNGNGQLKQKGPQPSPQNKGILVPAHMELHRTNDRSLQINIDSEDDAKSVIQNLQAIKAAYDNAGVLTSVEFVIAEEIAKKVEPLLLQAIRWCKTFIKHVAPQPGNILFPLPAFKDLSVPQVHAPAPPNSTSSVTAAPQAHVKPQRPVRADSARA